MADDVRLEGMDDVMKMLDSVTSTVNIQEALQKCCALVEREAKQNAPKDSGALRRSIASRVEGEQGIVFTPLEYAPYIEFGTGLFAEEGGRTNTPWSYQNDKGEWVSTNGIKPHPFLRPALENNRAKIKKILKGGLTKKK
jgi:HK97 gp10 family phage protein